MKKILFCVGFVFCNAIFIFAQTAAEKLKLQIEKLQKDADLKHAVFGVCILNAKTGKLVAEYNSEISLTPASTLKTLTTGAALGLLGKNFRYETLLQYTGKYDSAKGVIDGDLVIKGSGDPTLNSQYFRKKEDTLELAETWAKILKEKGIKKITGKIIADNSCFDNEVPSNWIWGDMGNYYGAPANGLSYSDNKFALYFKSGSAGEKTEIVSQKPLVPGLKITNKVTAGGSDDNAFIFGSPGNGDRMIRGTIPANQSKYEVEGSMPDPAYYCAFSLAEALKNAGIENSGKVEVVSEKGKTNGKTLYTHKSPVLEKIVYYTNMKSNNHYAETLLRTIAHRKNGVGTTSAGTDLVTEFWKGRGVETEGLFMNDGSGLSRANAISPLVQATILSKIYKDSLIYKSFNASLPVSGESGGMIGIGKGTCAQGNMRAKSGYITRARSYAGYVKTKSDEEYCFSFIVNNYSCSPKVVKGKIEDVLVLFCEF
ncbi:MAG: D-alanyl-D-alanine carboxypeptidase/D-alanyl-D-alanine-endopeptidase [Bacteroidia bacterium]|nr:D-alanyl-D-alanine carboxypeptidase/D-alanyl-D-alanine-endopeptidase [Bacteroidia bacterium]